MKAVEDLGAMPSFSEFYEAINRRPPFPWQSRLAAQVAREERWPNEVGVPTGLGKTACLDVAVWWLASQADLDPEHRTAPTRIWWLVNRRLLVDSTAEHAKHIRGALRDATTGQSANGQTDDVLAKVADRLRTLSAVPDADPLEVIRLRGGLRPALPTDPSTPAVLLATLPMFGSRLLFRGYGCSNSMRPIEAALAGTDSLVLVDEAHLVRHLIRLVPDLADCTRSARSILGGLRSRPQVVALTATGDAGHGNRFDLDHEDAQHPIVRQRLDAPKVLRVRRAARDAARVMAQEARLLLEKSAKKPTTCIVFANTPATAREVHGLLSKPSRSVGKSDVLLLTGRTREREAEKIRDRILDRATGMPATRDSSMTRDRHLVVVATQTLEVGADLDAECVVTETCGVRALTQRLGRLNRLGNYDHSEAVYVHVPPPKRRGRSVAKNGEWPVYGDEPRSLVRRLDAAIGDSEGVDVSPKRVTDVLGQPQDDPGRAPEVLPGLLWEWVKTTTPPEGEAPVEPYFSGIAGASYLVALIWRAHVPPSGERLWPRPTDREAVSVPIGEVRDALKDDETLCRLAADRVSIESASVDDLRPGDTVVLPIDRGMLDEFGWNPEASSPVVDVSVISHGLPLESAAIRRLCGLAVGDLVRRALGIVPDDEDADEADQVAAITELLTALEDVVPFGWERAEWEQAVSSLKPEAVIANGEVSRLRTRGEAESTWRSDALDETSLSPEAAELVAHGKAVAKYAKMVAKRLGLEERLVGVLETAGSTHDWGKADPRFQRWLDPHRASPVLLAKSSTPSHAWNATRRAAGWPRGGRHEALSARLVDRWMATDSHHLEPLMRDLLVHLAISHHGSGRPLVPPVADVAQSRVAGVEAAHSLDVAASLEMTDWNQPSRFWRLNQELGPWGLALLEAIVRRADHAVSSGAELGGVGDE